MIITRKIEIYIAENDSKHKKELDDMLHDWRNLVRRAANMICAHKFVQNNVRDFVYLKDDIQEKFYIKDILKEGKGMSEQNITYRLCSSILKGKLPSDVFACLNQSVSESYKKANKDILVGKASCRSYKNNIPIPFSSSAISNLHKNDSDGYYYFVLFGVPFCLRFGADRSGNQIIVDRCLAGEYRFCSSSIVLDDDKKKKFLLLSIDIPQNDYTPIEGNVLYARLDVENPIIYYYGKTEPTAEKEPSNKKKKDNDRLTDFIDDTVKAMQAAALKDISDAKSNKKAKKDITDVAKKLKEAFLAQCKVKTFKRETKYFTIGNREEFLHRRLQIQAAVRQCQINNRYTNGGHGRKQKTKALERWHEKEKNYVDAKLHLYSKLLVDAAVKHKCEKIVLEGQKEAEERAKKGNKYGEPFLLRNWSYYSLESKIEYKAKKYGITLEKE